MEIMEVEENQVFDNYFPMLNDRNLERLHYKLKRRVKSHLVIFDNDYDEESRKRLIYATEKVFDITKSLFKDMSDSDLSIVDFTDYFVFSHELKLRFFPKKSSAGILNLLISYHSVTISCHSDSDDFEFKFNPHTYTERDSIIFKSMFKLSINEYKRIS